MSVSLCFLGLLKGKFSGALLSAFLKYLLMRSKCEDVRCSLKIKVFHSHSISICYLVWQN